MRSIKYLLLSLFFTPFLVMSQSGFEKMKAEEEAFRKKQEKAEKKYADDYKAQLDSLHLQYIKYEIDREKEVLEFEGKNLDPRLVKKAQELEARKPRNASFFDVEESRSVLGELMKIEEVLIINSTNYELDNPKETNEKGEVFTNSSVPIEKEENVLLKEEEKEEKEENELANIFTINLSEIPNLSIEEKEIIELEFEANRPIYIPLKEKDYSISSHFNPNRMHPVLKKPSPHKGIDLAAKPETPIYATANGIVEIAQFSKSAGNWVLINHKNGYKTKYFHLTSFVVKPKQDVKAGELIGYVGNTGYLSGPHLHYEIRENNKPLNPKNFMVVHFGN